MQETGNEKLCVLNILINGIHAVKLMSLILFYLNQIYNFT